ncbi:MAG: SCO family protein [Myxococcota bacterium]
MVAGAFLALAATLAGAPALPADAMPAELKGIGIEERPGAELPRDLVFSNQEGQSVTLGSYLDGERPVLLVLAYYSCPMLCTLVLNGLNDGIKQLAWNAGDRYRVLTVSIDPRDGVDVARDKRANYVKAYGREVPARGWDFLVGTEENVRKLAQSVGFGYRWDEGTQQYAHAAGAFVVTPQGKLSRTLYGVVFPERDLRLSLVEASEGRMGGAWEKVLLFCFHYDPAARSYVLAATQVMRLGGLLTMLVLGGFLAWLWRRERQGARPITQAERLT